MVMFHSYVKLPEAIGVLLKIFAYKKRGDGKLGKSCQENGPKTCSRPLPHMVWGATPLTFAHTHILLNMYTVYTHHIYIYIYCTHFFDTCMYCSIACMCIFSWDHRHLGVRGDHQTLGQICAYIYIYVYIYYIYIYTCIYTYVRICIDKGLAIVILVMT